MNTATRKSSKLNPRSERMRLHGWTLGIVLLIASLLVASSMTAVVNFILIAIPVLTIAAIIAMFVAGGPMVAIGIEAKREADDRNQESPTLMGLEGFWKHPSTWERGHHPHYTAFQPVDHDIVIHLDSKSDDNSMTMGEFIKMTSGGAKNKDRGVEKSLEGVTDWRRA